MKRLQWCLPYWFVISLLCFCHIAHATTLSTHQGDITLTWLNGDPLSGYSQYGEPTNVVNINDQLPISLLNNIYNMLPEKMAVNPAFVDGSLQSNIIMDDDFTGTATVSVTFLNEGAGYRNALGYFLYDPSNPPTQFSDIATHKLIFPNASKRGEGRMDQGDRVDLDVELTAGQALGFFVIPNGWGWNGSYGNIHYAGPWNQPFYSVPQLNPEQPEKRYHNVIFYDATQDFLIVGFDDQNRHQGDNDFNDLLFSVEITPIYAVEGINEDKSVDAGSYNVLVQTGDRNTTSTSYYPSQNGYGTLMFEDRWPSMGDYDFNDLVVKYRFKLTQNNLNEVTQVEFTYQIQAIGASFHNGFALHIPGLDKANIASAMLSANGSNTELTPEALATETIFIVSEDVWQSISSNCGMFRTLADCNETIATENQLTVTFNQPVSLTQTGTPPFDPFIFASEGMPHGQFTGRGWEVHLKQFDGTSLFETSLLGQLDDASNNSNSFVNGNNFPWAMNLSDNWVQPVESTDITRAYPNFASWVQSDGKSSTDWYQRIKANVQHLFE